MFRRVRLHVEVFVAREQRVEHEVVDAFGLGINAHARIEIGGAALDDHGQRVGIGGLGAGESGRQHARGNYVKHCRTKAHCPFRRSEGSRLSQAPALRRQKSWNHGVQGGTRREPEHSLGEGSCPHA